LYVLEFLEKRQPFVNFLMRHKLTGMQKVNGSFEMIFSGTRSDHANVIDADIVIVATGYRWQFPHYLAPIAHRIEMRDERFDMREDYSLNWDGPEQNRIYAQNAARHTHGIADPNLCLMAWRSAVIINSIADANIYDIEHESTAIQWPAQSVNISTTERYATSA
jgi:lysine N6-hydroxylase